MSYTLTEAYVRADGTLDKGTGVDRVEHAATGVYNIFADTSMPEDKIFFEIKPRVESGLAFVVTHSDPSYLFDGTVVGAQVKFFKDFDTGQPVDCAFELEIQVQT